MMLLHCYSVSHIIIQTVPQYKAVGSTQREAIMKALNEDAEKLIAEYEAEGARDPALRRLQEEIRQCNKHYHELMSQCRDMGKSSSNSSLIYTRTYIEDDQAKLLCGTVI